LIDQETIVSQIFGGTDEKATSILMPTFTWAYDKSIVQPSFNVQEAIAELDKDGWKPGSDGIRTKDGKRLSLTLGTNSEESERVQSVEYIQNVFQ
ncbi:ABC transporter substrate-binding protein, partial [Rhizobiaceae sp. 2RAB30]